RSRALVTRFCKIASRCIPPPWTAVWLTARSSARRPAASTAAGSPRRWSVRSRVSPALAVGERTPRALARPTVSTRRLAATSLPSVSFVVYGSDMPRTRCYEHGVLIDEDFPLDAVSEHLREPNSLVWV